MQVKEQGPSNSGNGVQKGLFLFIHEGRRVLAMHPQTYLSALATCRKLFPHIPQNSEITFQSKDLDVCEGQLADISPELFELVVPLITSLVVNVVAPTSEGPRGVVPQIQPESTITLNLSIRGQTQPLRLQVQPSTNIVSSLRRVPALEEQWDRWTFYNVRTQKAILANSTFSSEAIQDHDTIYCLMGLRGGKPVIYLSSPCEVEAIVRLSLVPQWSFSAIYPVVPSKPRLSASTEQVEWRVRVHPNGDLTELTTELDVAYLFWEAHTNPQIPISPPPSPVLGQASLDKYADFDPVSPVLTDYDSVVLSFASITPYLDHSLKVLGLHTEARTSFITYWLPSFLKHKYIALRFLPQTAYEKAAPLEITPNPDTITRVFMLFRGVEEEELIEWQRAQARSANDVSFWADVAGVDLDKALDPTIFRVLEWGGMEVLQSKSSSVEA